MAYAKKTSKANEAFQKLKNDLAAGTAGNAYIFYGEETSDERPPSTPKRGGSSTPSPFPS